MDWAWRHNRRILIIEVRREPGASPDKFLPKKDTVMSLIAFDSNTGAFVAREEVA